MLVLLDVAVGLIFLYLLLSLLVSALMELVEVFLRMRAKDLSRALEHLVGSPETREKLYKHPLIAALRHVKRPADAKAGTEAVATGPSYLPAATFVSALVDTLARRGRGAVEAPADISLADIRAELLKNPDARLNQALLALMDTGAQNLAAFRASVERWYDDAMERTSGVYKRRAQLVALGIGFVLAGVLNADTLYIAKRLSSDSTLREALVAAATNHLAQPVPPDATPAPPTASAQPAVFTNSEPAPAAPAANLGDAAAQLQKRIEDLRELDLAAGLPLGWGGARLSTLWHAPDGGGAKQVDWGAGFLMLLGWALTAAAITIGAPFWFDLLGRVAQIRATVKPKEEPKQ